MDQLEAPSSARQMGWLACSRQEEDIKARIARTAVDSKERLGRHRRVIERKHAWLEAFAELSIRFEHQVQTHVALLSLACFLIRLRTLMRFC